MKEIEINLTNSSYKIYFEQNIINHVAKYIDHQDRKILIISDDLVPYKLIEKLKIQLNNAFLKIVKSGEVSKSLSTYESIIEYLLDNKFSRKDAIIALGGGVIGDLAGYVSSTYMRGIDFYQIPTTTLSQIDSSIGGKVAININKTKNCVGAFYQPKAVFIDIEALKTLPIRHYNSGLIEAVKAGILHNEFLFELFEKDNFTDYIEEIIYQALLFKKSIVEEDEKELGIRKILNLGHTLGHGFESYFNLSGLYHGEAVALGLKYVIKNEDILRRYLNIIKKLNIDVNIEFNKDEVISYILNDKKANHNGIEFIFANNFNEQSFKTLTVSEINALMEETI